MKVIALLILSLTVVVCEQQTLFAPHYISFDLKAPVPTGSRNSLRSAARVNRLAPRAGHRVRGDGDNEGYNFRPKSLKYGPGLQDSLRPIFDPECPSCFEAASDHHGLQPTPDPSMNLPEPTPVEPLAVRPINNGCPACDLEILFGLGGTAGPGATSF